MSWAVHASASLQRCPTDGSRQGVLAVGMHAAMQVQGLYVLDQSGICLLDANEETTMHTL